MKIKISDSFLAVLAVMIALNGIKLFLFIMFTCILHEFAHFFAIFLLKLKVEEFSITFVGGSIKCSKLPMQSNINLVFVYISGIIVNFSLGFLCNFIASNGFYSRNFFILSGINFLFAIFNSLPIKILDGYFILKYFLLIFFKNEILVTVICDFISVVFNFLLVFLGVYLAFASNFSILIISLYLLFSSLKNFSFF
ncbi:MAG: hypothetical protein R3Y12_00605 [Clostridia bacterium]